MSEIARLVYNDDDFLCHHGGKDQKNGVRRWQYPDDFRDSFVYYNPADDYNELQRDLARKDPEKS